MEHAFGGFWYASKQTMGKVHRPLMPIIKIIGGHGRVALKIASELSQHPGNIVISLFRNPADWDEVAATGAVPELFDLTEAKVPEFLAALKGADVIIWSAGNGGRGGPRCTYAIDRDAAVFSMQAARQLGGVYRYIMVSYLGSSDAPALSSKHPLYHYGQAKHQADDYLKNKSGLKYTIVNPGQLNNNKGTNTVDLNIDHRQVAGRSISRDNVAKIVATLLVDEQARASTLYREIECLDGKTPIVDGLRKLGHQ